MKFGFFAAAAALALSLSAATDYSKMAEATADKAGDAPLGTAWHAQHLAEVNEATADDALAAFVQSRDDAVKLLSRAKGDYSTDPLSAVRIAAVTQYVMVNADKRWYEFWKTSRSRERAVWTDAIVLALEIAPDEGTAIFLLDQLRWCGRAEQSAAVEKAIANFGKSSHVAQFAAQVLRELRRECPGL